MAQIGRKIYYEKTTGNVILDTGECWGDVVETTMEQDFTSYTVLAERVPETVGVISLDFGQDQENFNQYQYHVDTGTGRIVWDLTPEQEEAWQERQTLEERITNLETAIDQIVEVITTEMRVESTKLQSLRSAD